jgi:hypothetical protein
MIFDISKKSVNICQILADIYKCIMIVLFVIMSVLDNEIQEAGMEKQVIQVYHVIRKRDHPAILGQHSPIATRRWPCQVRHHLRGASSVFFRVRADTDDACKCGRHPAELRITQESPVRS